MLSWPKPDFSPYSQRWIEREEEEWVRSGLTKLAGFLAGAAEQEAEAE